jgi:hypothetical protein
VNRRALELELLGEAQNMGKMRSFQKDIPRVRTRNRINKTKEGRIMIEKRKSS